MSNEETTVSSEGFRLAATWLARVGWLIVGGVCLALGSLALLATFICGVEVYAETQAQSFSLWPAVGALAAGTATVTAGAYLRRCLWNVVRPIERRYSNMIATGAIRRGGA